MNDYQYVFSNEQSLTTEDVEDAMFELECEGRELEAVYNGHRWLIYVKGLMVHEKHVYGIPVVNTADTWEPAPECALPDSFSLKSDRPEGYDYSKRAYGTRMHFQYIDG